MTARGYIRGRPAHYDEIDEIWRWDDNNEPLGWRADYE